ncbi:MAG TPA: hypothetical protein PLO88_05420 [Bacilli bacterium]|nr:MAG: hypothetical protein BWY97_00093 [Tenericutes bacterium ADurb.BinA124]HPN61550.1 hypothetical protein [Bacilli bacterium]HPX84619.1 hypothetical protein [Bacilli bacterium]HQC75027.1 hypothetical protein [Bacilli bacterium]
MDDKRKIGNVYCIVKVDQFQKVHHGFSPLGEIPIKDETKLAEYLEAKENQIKALEQKVDALAKSFASILTAIGGGTIENE